MNAIKEMYDTQMSGRPRGALSLWICWWWTRRDWRVWIK